MSKLYDRPEVCATYFFPMPSGPLPREKHAQPVDMALPDGTRIGAYWCRSLQGAPTLLYLHGNGECIEHQLGHWPGWARGAGCNVLFVDYPGYATSDGSPTFSSCSAAAVAAREYLLAQSPAEVPLVIVAGRSVGSIFALHAAATTGSPRVRGLMLESGVADLKQRLAFRVPFEATGIDRRAFDAELDADFDHRAKLQRSRGPVLVLHCRFDSLVPAWNGEQLAGWAGSRLLELVLFDVGDHNSIQLVNAESYCAHLAELVRAAQSSTDG
jgi:pimeloyl-ACP methyl ester carboxylesterase